MKFNLCAVAVSAVLSTTLLASGPADAGLSCCRKITRTVERAVKDTGKTVGKAAGDVVRETGKGANNVVEEVGKAGHNVVKETGKAGENIAVVVGKAGSDTVKEVDRGAENVAELGVAVGNYLVRSVDDTADQISAAEQRIREGKIADAFWHLGVDPLTDTESRAAKLAQESSLANTAGAVAASAYGGPGGAAAYSAWYAYRQTGDVGLALKAGLISGATSASLSGVSGMPVDKATLASDLTKKTIMAGAVGGLAVAAAGGDGDAVRDGFLRSGGMVLIQDGYREFTKGDNTDPNLKGQDLVKNTRAAEFDAFCSLSAPPLSGGTGCSAPPREWFKSNPDGSLAKVDGKPVLDMAKVDPRYSYVGLAVEAGQKASWLTAETGPVMNGIAKIPGMNAMAIFHDQWVIQAPLSGWTNQATIIPAVVLTYMGTEAGIQNEIQDSIAKGAPAPTTSPSQPARDVAFTQAKSVTDDAASPAGSFLCMKGPGITEAPGKGRILSRSIFVTKGATASELACAVIYQKDQESKEDFALWYAVNDANYCEPKAEQFAAEHAAEGWKCLAR